MKKICFLVQRYGNEVNGGAEYLCKLYAERLIKYYDVTVLTSCAIDHVTWNNEYKEEMVEINKVKVHRFNVVEQRDINIFAGQMGVYFGNEDRDFFDDFSWLYDNGPKCPNMYKYLVDHKDDFEVFLFMGYLYYSTTFCMQEVAERAILISTAHDELPLNQCGMFNAQFNLPAAMMYLTEEERRFVFSKFHNSRLPCIVTGSGVTLPEETAIDAQKDILDKIGEEYIVYIGRIEQGKSCDFLFDMFIEYKKRYGGKVKLALAGKSIMPIPQREDIIWLGFVSEEEKFAMIKNAKALVLASHQESLSIVVLEAMTLGIPVFVNANCDVLKGHIEKSKAGLYFYKGEDFLTSLHFLLTDDESNKKMGENGKIHMKNNYSWEVIDQKMIDIIEQVCVYE